MAPAVERVSRRDADSHRDGKPERNAWMDGGRLADAAIPGQLSTDAETGPVGLARYVPSNCRAPGASAPPSISASS
jgi:hypothetical protein